MKKLVNGLMLGLSLFLVGCGTGVEVEEFEPEIEEVELSDDEVLYALIDDVVALRTKARQLGWNPHHFSKNGERVILNDVSDYEIIELVFNEEWRDLNIFHDIYVEPRPVVETPIETPQVEVPKEYVPVVEETEYEPGVEESNEVTPPSFINRTQVTSFIEDTINGFSSASMFNLDRVDVVQNFGLNDGSHVANINLEFTSRSARDAEFFIERAMNNLAVILGEEGFDISRIHIFVSAPYLSNSNVALSSWDRAETDTSRVILDDMSFFDPLNE